MYMLLFSHSVVSDSLWPYGLPQARLPCSLQSPGVCSNSSSHRICSKSCQWCHPAISSFVSLPLVNLSQNQGFFQWAAVCITWPKYWSFCNSISSSNEYSGLISFRTDWFDLLAVQGNLKSLLQYHNSKASILQWSAFFMVQLSHPYTITRKTIALTRWTFVSKVMSLLVNTLSRFIIAS